LKSEEELNFKGSLLRFSARLGSVPELPADSCKEIKASEGEMVSGHYWFVLERLRDAVQVFCDMQTEGTYLGTFGNVELF